MIVDNKNNNSNQIQENNQLNIYTKKNSKDSSIKISYNNNNNKLMKLSDENINNILEYCIDFKNIVFIKSKLNKFHSIKFSSKKTNTLDNRLTSNISNKSSKEYLLNINQPVLKRSSFYNKINNNNTNINKFNNDSKYLFKGSKEITLNAFSNDTLIYKYNEFIKYAKLYAVSCKRLYVLIIIKLSSNNLLIHKNNSKLYKLYVNKDDYENNLETKNVSDKIKTFSSNKFSSRNIVPKVDYDYNYSSIKDIFFENNEEDVNYYKSMSQFKSFG